MADLHGERSQEGYAAPGNAITGALYPMAIRYGYGELLRLGQVSTAGSACSARWPRSRPWALNLSCGSSPDPPRNVGLAREEVIEAVIQTAPYSGFPRALNGLAILSEVFQGDA